MRAIIADVGAGAVIPSSRSRKVLVGHDIQAYRAPNFIERCLSNLKYFGRFAKR